MAQHDYDIANQSGANFRADLNNALDAIVSNNSGSSEPSTTFAYEWWIDTSANVLKLRNSANNAWITLPLSITADNSTSGALTVNGNLSTTGTLDVNGGEVILDADADTSITADTDDQIDFKIGNVDVATLTNSHLVLKGTTPKITIGDGGEEDTALIFDGNAQDFYIGLDDSADDLVIGKGSTVGTTPALSIDENLLSTFAGAVTVQGAFTSLGIDDNADATAITIDSSENVGIGTSSPASVLHIYDGGANTANTITFGNPSGTPKGEIHYTAGGSEFLTISAKGTNSSLGNIVFETGGTPDERMRIAANGNVGVGTASPLTKLTVSGDYITQTDGTRTMYLGSDGTGGLFGTSTNHYLRFLTNNTERMRIDSSGNFLLNTTSIVSGYNSRLVLEYSGTSHYGMSIKQTGTGTTNAISILSAGNSLLGRCLVTNTTCTWAGSSDYRLKEDVKPMEKGLERVLKLKPSKFKWVGEDTEDEGFIAHEVQEAGWSSGVFGNKDDKEMQTMDYGKLVPLLTKAIQEQQTQIEALQSEINTLKGGE